MLLSWQLLEIGYNFYFQFECLDGMERDHVQRTLTAIRALDDPLTYDQLLTSCPQHERLIISVIDSDLLLCLILHDANDDKYPNCLELVKITNSNELNF